MITRGLPFFTSSRALSLRSTKSAVLSYGKTRKRNFYASSNHHSDLLANAEIHKLVHKEKDKDEPAIHKYVLVAHGMTEKQVETVPQLHLAHLFLQGDTMFGAKVINKTLGTPVQVCGKLVDAVINEEIPKQFFFLLFAKSTLHGLSEDYILPILQKTKNPQEGVTAKMLEQLEKSERQNLIAIAQGSKDFETLYRGACKQVWGRLATDYIREQRLRLNDGSDGQGAEVSLYLSKGARLRSILHLADTSEYRDTCAGAMALFSFGE